MANPSIYEQRLQTPPTMMTITLRACSARDAGSAGPYGVLRVRGGVLPACGRVAGLGGGEFDSVGRVCVSASTLRCTRGS